jgi:hypothetical protein
MEEFVILSGDIVELHVAADITGISQEDLRKMAGYFYIEIPEIELDIFE